MFRASVLTALITSLATLMGGCIKNDIPYPRIQADITEFRVEGQIGNAIIDDVKRTIVVTLSEETNISEVKVLECKLGQGCRLEGDEEIKVLDLSSPVTINVELYQTYEWTISAVQNIERYFIVKGQIGSSTIDVTGKRVIFMIPETMDITKVYVESIKLGPVGSIMSPDINESTVDFSTGVEINVTSHGETSLWHIYAQITPVTVFTNSVDAWTQVAWVYGEAEDGKDNGFEYRLASSDSWTKVPSDWIEYNGGSMTGRIIHLSPMTEYAVRAYSNDEYGEELTFTTQQAVQMPDSSFDDWWLDEKIWNPWLPGQEPYWDTGNKGATSLGSSNVMPTDESSSGTGKAALLKTEFKGVGSIGKLAAGSLFAGTFVRTDGTNGVLSFGRSFEQRPTKLKGWFKYHTAPISHTSTRPNLGYMKGEPDTCIVWVALIDSSEPFEIRTNPNNLQLFNPDGNEVIAYGSMQCGYNVDDYSQFEITLNYKSTSRIPSYILCVSSSSKYGDYFTGGVGSELFIDDFELLYDY